ncbi:hypothetical protein HK096_002451 [Nowakowskiella sp. JEL0078]|nr:hypothetical protein HK096_002451 [Nowakowskiella sp. JEL0078]
MAKILFLGEANCSFALAFASLLLTNPISNNLAYSYLGLDLSFPGISKVNFELYITTFEPTEEALLSKYPDVLHILASLRKITSLSIDISHGINAWELPRYFPSTKFDVIIWNHPHLGTEDFRLHRFLMAHFFHSAVAVLTKESTELQPRILISLVEGQAERWSILPQAQRVGFSLISASSFDESVYPGYECKRNKTGQTFKNLGTRRWFGEMKSILLRFGNTSNVGLKAQLDLLLDPTEGIIVKTPIKNVDSEQKFEVIPHTNIQIRKNRVKLVNVIGDFNCDHCGKVLTSMRAYKQHVHMVHELDLFGGEGNYPCVEANCKKTFKRENDLWQHVINKHKSVSITEINGDNEIEGQFDIMGSEYEYYPCGECGQSVIKSEWGMELHLETLKPAIGLGMACPLCSKDSIDRLKQLEVNRRFRDQINKKTFCERRALFQHYKFCREKHLKIN